MLTAGARTTLGPTSESTLPAPKNHEKPRETSRNVKTKTASKKTEETSTIEDFNQDNFKISSNIPVSNRFSVLDNDDVEDTSTANPKNSSNSSQQDLTSARETRNSAFLSLKDDRGTIANNEHLAEAKTELYDWLSRYAQNQEEIIKVMKTNNDKLGDQASGENREF